MRCAWRLLAFCTALSTGCSLTPISSHQPGSTPHPVAANTKPLKGMVHGGQQPIQGASVYLFALSTGGYGQPSASLLLSTGPDTMEDANGLYYVTTNSTGGFTIGVGDYSCGQSGPQQVYLYSVGGNPQVGGSDNSAAGVMAVLGQCVSNSFSGLPASVQMNEVTTVAAAYALAGYASDAKDMSGSNTALAATGMANAALSATNLASIATGQALSTTPAGNGTVPVNEINTLADILAACINSSGPGPDTACTDLFSTATADGTPAGLQPTDTATAAINIAHNPGANVAALYDLATTTAPFQPILTGTSPYNGPNDWTIAIAYTGGGLSGYPQGIAIDGQGNVWTADYESSITELNTLGAPLSPSTGYTGGGLDYPYRIAIDLSGDAWVTNEYGYSLSEFGSSGTPLSPSTGYTGGGLDYPLGIAIDASGHVWAGNYTEATFSEFSSSGGAISGSSGDPGGGLEGPEGIAVDTSGDVWAGDSNSKLSEFNTSTGMPVSPTGYTGGGMNYPISIAIDRNGNVWTANYNSGANSISEFSSSGTPVSGSGGYTGGGLQYPDGIAIDGAGNVWVANLTNATISEFSSSGMPISGSGGYTSGDLYTPYQIEIDGSGNVWVVNSDETYVTEFVGAATPVVTPLVAGVANNALGARP